MGPDKRAKSIIGRPENAPMRARCVNFLRLFRALLAHLVRMNDRSSSHRDIREVFIIEFKLREEGQGRKKKREREREREDTTESKVQQEFSINDDINNPREERATELHAN